MSSPPRSLRTFASPNAIVAADTPNASFVSPAPHAPPAHAPDAPVRVRRSISAPIAGRKLQFERTVIKVTRFLDGNRWFAVGDWNEHKLNSLNELTLFRQFVTWPELFVYITRSLSVRELSSHFHHEDCNRIDMHIHSTNSLDWFELTCNCANIKVRFEATEPIRALILDITAVAKDMSGSSPKINDPIDVIAEKFADMYVPAEAQ